MPSGRGQTRELRWSHAAEERNIYPVFGIWIPRNKLLKLLAKAAVQLRQFDVISFNSNRDRSLEQFHRYD